MPVRLPRPRWRAQFWIRPPSPLAGALRPELVEEDVGGDLERAGHVERPVDRVVGVVEGQDVDLRACPVEDRRPRRQQPALQRRGRGDRLERRPGRIGAPDRAVEERRAGLLRSQLLVLGLGDRLGEDRRVEGRARAHAEDRRRCGRPSRRRRRAARTSRAPPRRSPGRWGRSSAGRCRPGTAGVAAGLALRATERVDLDLGGAGPAAQEAVVLVLDARLADLVARLQARVAGLLELLRGDLADAAEELRRRGRRPCRCG